MTEPSKHKHAADPAAKPAAKPPTRSSGGSRKAAQPRAGGSRFAWIRTTRGQVAIAVVVLAVAVLARVLATSGGDDAAARKAAQDALPGGYGTTWTVNGAAYRLTILPVAKTVLDASASQCVTSPAAGRANVRFQVRIDNLSSKAVPVPKVRFGVNTTAKGAITKGTSFAKLSRRIDITQAGVQACAAASQLGPTSSEEIAEGGSALFAGIIGGVRTPVGDGLLLIADYGSGQVTATFGTFS